jgi:hypothetical protein
VLPHFEYFFEQFLFGIGSWLLMKAFSTLLTSALLVAGASPKRAGLAFRSARNRSASCRCSKPTMVSSAAHDNNVARGTSLYDRAASGGERPGDAELDERRAE